MKKVWPVALKEYKNVKENEISRDIYRMLLRWVKFSESHFSEWNGRPNCGHFFGGSYWYGLETALTVLVYSAISEYGQYDESVTGVERSEILTKAVKAIRYLGFTHDTGPVDCVREKSLNPHCSNKKWGGSGDGFFQASQHGTVVFPYGLAAWIIWDHLDEETRILVQNVVASYADRWSGEEPRNGVYFDTQTEENGWTGMGISIAAMMFPEHPNNKIWVKGMTKWLLNTSTIYSDLADDSKYLDIPVGKSTFSTRAWINTVTTHPDFTAENHGFVHPNYMSAGPMFKARAALAMIIAGKVPDPVIYRLWDDIYDNVLKVWTTFDGITIPVQGQDWWYGQYPSHIELHAATSVFRKNNDAAHIERKCLAVQDKIQESNKNGCLMEAEGEKCRITEFQSAREMESGAASSLTYAYLIHLFGGSGSKPSGEADFIGSVKGVFEYPYGSSIVLRTENTFSAYSWRNCAMALTIPENGMWTVTALTSSYLGEIKVSDAQNTLKQSGHNAITSVLNERHVKYNNSFSASARISRGNEQVLQDFSFIVLPGGNSVYIERLFAEKDCIIDEIRTGQIGIRNEKYSEIPVVAKGYRSVSINGKSADVFHGYYGGSDDRIVSWNNVETVNIDDEIGYILYNSKQVEYFNRHIYPKWKGIEDILTLNLCLIPRQMKKGDISDPFITITLPNSDAVKTRNVYSASCLMSVDDIMTDALIVGSNLIFNNSNFDNTTINANGKQEISGIKLFQGYNRFEKGSYAWSGSARGRETSYLECIYSVMTDDTECCFEADISTNNRMNISNLSQNQLHVKIDSKYYDAPIEVEIKAGGFISINGTTISR